MSTLMEDSDDSGDIREEKPEFPEGVNLGIFMQEAARAKETGEPIPVMRVTDMFKGADYERVRSSLFRDGVATFKTQEGVDQTIAVDMDEKGHVFAVAAGIPRSPGRAEDFLNQVSDFTEAVENRIDEIALYNRIYAREGLVNNAVNKSAALVATKGSFKVRRVKGQRGKGGDKRAEEFRTLLQFWAENVNAAGVDSVITGARGIQAFIAQGVRQCLIEGDHVARSHWNKVKVPVLSGKAYSLPINLQSFGGDAIEIPTQLAGSTIELIFWKPPQSLIDTLNGQGADAKILKPYIDKLIPRDVQRALIKDGKYLLDPQLMMHIKHRGTQKDPYGESFIRAAMTDIAYKRALQALDIVTIENLINRMLIIKIGSDNDKSVYHKQEVTQRRVAAMQNMLRRIGPSSTIVWAGPDVDVVEVGAHGKILEMDQRYAMANSMIRASMGVPSALLTGEGSDGKAAGWAAITGVAAQLGELQNQYAQWLKTLAERIAEENGFEDVDVTWEFHQNLLANRAESVDMMNKAYAAGAISTQTFVEDGLGLSYEAEESRQLEDVAKGYKTEAFGPPKGLEGQNPSGLGGEEGGRPADSVETDPRDGKETESPVENK